MPGCLFFQALSPYLQWETLGVLNKNEVLRVSMYVLNQIMLHFRESQPGLEMQAMQTPCELTRVQK